MLSKDAHYSQYFESFAEKYPEVWEAADSPINFMKLLHSQINSLSEEIKPQNNRFCSVMSRGFLMDQNAWELSKRGGIKWIDAHKTYRGLFNLKTPFDLQLYSNLLWELKPKTIIEFGSLQGGSAFWLADQAKVLGLGAHVHSFDLFTEAVHQTAKDCDNITFHKIDLNYTEEFDKQFLLSLPRPWLVIEDSHINLHNIISFVANLLIEGDYFIIEDLFIKPGWANPANIVKMCNLIESCGLVVDTKYVDAFGYNVTAAPNAWLKKLNWPD